LLLTLLVRAGGYGIFLPETKPRIVFSVRAERFAFSWLAQKGTGLFPFELEGTAIFGCEPKLTGKKKFAPKLSVPTIGAHNGGVPVREQGDRVQQRRGMPGGSSGSGALSTSVVSFPDREYFEEGDTLEAWLLVAGGHTTPPQGGQAVPKEVPPWLKDDRVQQSDQRKENAVCSV